MDRDRFIAKRYDKLGQHLNGRNTVQVFEQAPSPVLRPFIKRFLVVEFPALHRDAHLPDTNPVAAFSFRGECRLDGNQWAPPTAFTGLRETLRTHEHCHSHAVLLATFTPVGAAAFLQPPLEEFSGTTTDLAGILGRPEELDQLHEQLAEAQNHGRRVKLLEDFLIARVRVSAPDPLVAAAVAWLDQGAGARRIGDLTQYIGLSQSALERRFRRIIGISPKKFASMVRLRHAVRLRAAGADLTAIAHAAGYFDQSHFIKDFRRAIGSTPDAFFRQTLVN
ncbi:MAG: bacterial regulatory helix-turn-helix s, AraC family protein [Pedosphaera sp.]|nr:bacterial regulatory helix-turn-helix s, AraC family protein [Pedosphaera sp.]